MSLEQKLNKALNSNNEELMHDVFEEIYNSYSKLVYFIINQKIQNKMDSEELTQDVFIAFFNNITKTSIKNIKYYLIQSAKNKVLNYLKQRKDNILFDENIVYEKVDNHNHDKDDVINRMHEILNDFEVEIIVNHIIYDYTFKELSVIYNKNINSIISIYNRALRKYKKGVKSFECQKTNN